MIKESLDVIEQESDRLAAMVEDLLDATRLQSGILDLKKAEVDLRQLVAELVTRFSHQEGGDRLRVDFPVDFPVIDADETRINQLLSNLISNSLKYSESGEILVSGETEGNRVRVCVTDLGRGFDPMDIPFVFDRFYRSETATRTTKGTGLGLYLCRAIVEAHDGKIWVDETYKQGGRVCFWLPIRHDTPKTEA